MSPSISVRFLQTQSDERLLAAAREGHERAFEALVARHRRALLRYCRRLLVPAASAEDALQQGLLQAWLALRRGTEVRDVRAWLYRVVHNAAVDQLRSSGYDHEQLSEALEGARAPHSDLERRIAVRQTLAGLAALPELQREALLRTAVEGHSHEQVAAALGISDGTLRGLVYRARLTLRAAMTAITPPPLVAWAAHAGRRGAPLAQRLGDLGAGAGAAGATGAVLKGGAAVLTAGALLAGAAAVHQGSPRGAHDGRPRILRGMLAPRAVSAPEAESAAVSSSSAGSDRPARALGGTRGTHAGSGRTSRRSGEGPARVVSSRDSAGPGDPGPGGHDARPRDLGAGGQGRGMLNPISSGVPGTARGQTATGDSGARGNNGSGGDGGVSGGGSGGSGDSSTASGGSPDGGSGTNLSGDGGAGTEDRESTSGDSGGSGATGSGSDESSGGGSGTGGSDASTSSDAAPPAETTPVS